MKLGVNKMAKKIVLITGASSGIGKETAKELIQAGHTVYCAARSLDKMRDLEEIGGHPLELDITKHETIAECVDKIIQEQGRIDVLFNNAGFGLYGSIEETNIEDARYQFEVNLFGLARITQLVLPHMREQRSGTIINTSSVGGKIYTPLGAWYHATKHAVEGWSDCLRLEVKQFGINVVIIEPGFILTSFGSVLTEPMLKRSGDGPYKKLAQAVAKGVREQNEKTASPPSVIAKTVLKAVNAANPDIRYAAGKFAKPLILMRKWLGDKLYDRIIMNQVVK
jgi:Short-chain alcohol dehydrogenase of unknown specificity